MNKSEHLKKVIRLQISLFSYLLIDSSPSIMISSEVWWNREKLVNTMLSQGPSDIDGLKLG